jgi:hypothetical protein
VFVRILSALSIVCVVAAIALVVFGVDQSTPVVVALVLAVVGISTLLGLRAGYHKARSIISDASGFLGGNVQHARLVDVSDPKGIFWPKSTLELELEGEDGNRHRFQREVPVPFFVAWSHRLGRRFDLPLMRTDLSELMAFELRREGMDVSVGRSGAPKTPV